MSCGCYNREKLTEVNSKDLSGKKFNSLTVVNQIGRIKIPKLYGYVNVSVE